MIVLHLRAPGMPGARRYPRCDARGADVGYAHGVEDCTCIPCLKEDLKNVNALYHLLSNGGWFRDQLKRRLAELGARLEEQNGN